MRPRSGSLPINVDVQQKVLDSKKIYDEIGKGKSIDFNSKELYLFIFSVGQANFCLLRRENKVVIVDAGKGSFGIPLDTQIIQKFLDSSTIEAVFITHPHVDHFDLFNPTKTNNGLLDKLNKETTFYLGGEESDWRAKKRKHATFIKNISDKRVNINYMGRGHESMVFTLLDGCNFHVFGIIAPKVGKDLENSLSLIIQVTMNGKNIMFLGDSEGDSIDRFKGTSIDIRSLCYLPGVDNEIKKEINQLYSEIYEKITSKIISFSKDGNLWIEYDDKSIDNLCSKYWELCYKFEKGKYKFSVLSILTKGKKQEDIKDKANYLNDLFSNYKEKNSNETSSVIIENEISTTSKMIKELLNVFCFDNNQLIKEFKDDFAKNEKRLEDLIIDNNNQLIYLLNIVEKTIFVDYLNTLVKRKLFECSNLIILPHHGTNTNCSQRFLGYFVGLPGERAFIVCSSPFESKCLPKRSTLEMAPIKPTHPAHLFSFCQDNEINNVCMQPTTKPIYVTGMAPGGAYCFKISERPEDMSIYMLDLYEDESFWFNILSNYHKPYEIESYGFI